MLLIINADDLGASVEVNTEVFELMRAGLVTSATLMANGPAFAPAARGARLFPNCSFGVHLNLTSFSPLTDPGNLEPILRHGEFRRELLTDGMCRRLRPELTQELVMQVGKVLDAGVNVSHLDSHHFIHLRPVLFPVIKAVQKRFGIRKFRSSVGATPRKKFFQRIHGIGMDFLFRHVYRTSVPDAWCDFEAFQHAASKRLPSNRILELMVHPGTDNKSFQREIRLLRSGWEKFLAVQLELGNYHSLSSV